MSDLKQTRCKPSPPVLGLFSHLGNSSTDSRSHQRNRLASKSARKHGEENRVPSWVQRVAQAWDLLRPLRASVSPSLKRTL